jgi:hypothetical protein
MSRITETEVVDAVEGILSERPSGEATIAELIHEMPNRLTLSKEDWAQSTTRPNEPMWHQQVRNITSHKNFGYGMRAPADCDHRFQLIATKRSD